MTSPRPVDLDDLPVHIVVSGRPEGPPIILVHGFGANRHTWRHWAPLLEPEFRVFQYEMKGSGDAPKPKDGAYAPEDQAALLVRTIEKLDLRDLTLVGHSLGGGVSLLAALRLLDAGRFDRLRSLVLVAAASLPQKVPRYIRMTGIPGAATLLRAFGGEWAVRWVLEQIVFDSDAVDDDWVRGYSEPLIRPGAIEALIAAGREIVPPDMDERIARYPELTLPILLLWGRHDPVVPIRVGEELHRRLPDSELEILERCGHSPPEERPDESAARVADFIRRSGNAP